MKKIINFLLIFITTGLVLYFSLKDDYKVVINTILNINKFWLFLGFLLVILYWFTKSIVTVKIARKFKKTYSIKESLKMTLETNFFHAITPFSSGGQPYEIYSLKKNGLRITDATNVSMSCFIVYQIALVLLGIIAIIANYFGNFYPDNIVLKRLVTLGFIINFIVIVVLFLLTFTSKISKSLINFGINILCKLKIVKNKEKTKDNFSKYLNDFHDGAKQLLTKKREFILLIGIQFLSLCCLYLIPYALIKGINLSINPFIVIITSAYVMLIGSFVPIPGGTGGLEYGFVAFFSSFVGDVKLNAIMLLWRFITYYFGMIIGSIILSVGKKEKR